LNHRVASTLIADSKKPAPEAPAARGTSIAPMHQALPRINCTFDFSISLFL
jgi:hypothetical protein